MDVMMETHNPHEKFMLMLLERMEALEDKMEIILGNIKHKSSVKYVVLIHVEHLDPGKHTCIFDCLQNYFDIILCFFGLDSFQFVVHNNNYLIHIDEVMKVLFDTCAIRVSRIRIDKNINMNEVTCIMNGEDEYKIQKSK